jgi:N6-adenosine-specific RNA methylase IME4
MNAISNTNTITPPTTGRRYACVVMDPPWDLQQKGGRGAQRHYSLMSVDQIAAMPIPELLEDNAHVWIWTTVATRFLAQRIAEAHWGLTFRSELIWDKRKTGLGNYLRGSHETLLLFTRGKAPILYRGQRDVVDFPVQEHSVKPAEALVLVQRCSGGPYLELFARRRFPGFDHWGDEVPGGADIVIPGYPVPAYSVRARRDVGHRTDWADGVVRSAA